jgi:hypothetical protein
MPIKPFKSMEAMISTISVGKSTQKAVYYDCPVCEGRHLWRPHYRWSNQTRGLRDCAKKRMKELGSDYASNMPIITLNVRRTYPMWNKLAQISYQFEKFKSLLMSLQEALLRSWSSKLNLSPDDRTPCTFLLDGDHAVKSGFVEIPFERYESTLGQGEGRLFPYIREAAILLADDPLKEVFSKAYGQVNDVCMSTFSDIVDEVLPAILMVEKSIGSFIDQDIKTHWTSHKPKVYSYPPSSFKEDRVWSGDIHYRSCFSNLIREHPDDWQTECFAGGSLRVGSADAGYGENNYFQGHNQHNYAHEWTTDRRVLVLRTRPRKSMFIIWRDIIHLAVGLVNSAEWMTQEDRDKVNLFDSKIREKIRNIVASSPVQPKLIIA